VGFWVVQTGFFRGRGHGKSPHRRSYKLLNKFATDERAMLGPAPRVALTWLIPQDGNVARVTGLWRVHGEPLQLILGSSSV
jgi:hypothetical protein